MVTNPDYSRLTQLIKILNEVALLEEEKKTALTQPIGKVTHSLLEHRLLFLKEQLKGYKYYEIECVNLLLADTVNAERVSEKLNQIRNQRKSTNNVKKAINRPVEPKEEFDLFLYMLAGWIQANTNRFDNSNAMNILLQFIVELLEEDNYGRKKNYGY